MRRLLKLAAFQDAELVFDIEAIALQYGFYNSLRDAISQEQYVMFVDVGYSHGSVFCAHFDGSDVTFPFCCVTESCSGRVFDQILTEIVETELEKQGVPRAWIHGNPRVKSSIRSSCEKSKCILSSEGAERVTIQVRGIRSDCEVSVEVTRDAWNRQCAKYRVFEVLQTMCEKCLFVRVCWWCHGQEVDGVDCVILEGSSARYNTIRALIEGLLSSERYGRHSDDVLVHFDAPFVGDCRDDHAARVCFTPRVAHRAARSQRVFTASRERNQPARESIPARNARGWDKRDGGFCPKL